MPFTAEQPDLVIRGGTIVDGTGAQSFIGDVAVTGDKITAVGHALGVRGKQEYDASGLLVTPGWIDPHTHFDAQWSWDPYLSPSSAVGVTTCIMGNCGIGFAPCQEDRRDFLAHLVEAVEDIPGRVIAEGLKYDFETFEEYMDSIERKEFACDVAVMIGHSAVRTWVMGKRANLSDRPGGAKQSPVLPHEVEAMAALVKDAVAAGALGFSTSRLLVHRDPTGTLTPGALAGTDEVRAISQAIAEGGGGVFQMSTDFKSYDDVTYRKLDAQKVSDYERSEEAWMVDVARKHGKKVAFTFNVVPVFVAGQRVVDAVNAAGGLAKGQALVRPQGFLLAMGGRLHPFVVSKFYQAVVRECKREGADLLERLREPAVREKVLAETHARLFGRGLRGAMAEFRQIFQPWSQVFRWTPGYEPQKVEDSVEAMAAATGKPPLEVAYDAMAAGTVLWKPQVGLYDGESLQPTYELLQHPSMIPGFADGGAHGTIFQDATVASYMLTHWVRDRTQGPRLSVEEAVRKQTMDVAQLFGLSDRGVLAPGKKADLNVIDLNSLAMCKPYLADDMPLKQQRWMQEVPGYRLTLVSGCPTFRNGEATGGLPGRLVRNPHREASVWQGVAPRVSGPFESGLLEPTDLASGERALEGMGSSGASAAARVLRSSVEAEEAPRSRL